MRQVYNFVIEPKDLYKAGLASSFIKGKLVKLNINRNIIRRIAIATYEAEVNIVIHSYGGSCTFIITDDNLEMFFEDNGPGIESIDYAMLEGTSTAPRFAVENGFGAGMGLPNMKKVSDNFDISSSRDGTNIKMLFNLRGNENEG